MDPLRTLFADLHSPDPSIRFSVLSRVEDLEWNEEQLAGLRNLAAQEKDPGTRFHMRKILARIEREKGRNQAPPPTAQEIKGLLQNSRRDDLSLALLLSALPRQEGPAVVQALRETHWTESNPAVLPSILHFLKKHGGPGDVGAIESLCRHADPRVLAAAVETLEKLNPERLKDLIVPLLVNPIHGIRSRAVRLLYRWDPQEALRHFEAMLFSEDPDDRQAALFHAFFFPFPEIEPLMVKFLGMENDPDMLERAGFLFRANPAPEEPLRLLEAREASLGEKKRLIGEILAGVVDSLYQAGLVQKRPADLLAELEGIFFRRRALQLLDSYQLSLQSADPDDRRDAALRLAELIQRGFREAIPILEAWLGKESDPQLKALLTARLQCLVAAPRPGAAK
ncbi:MAG: HEAT repeat domain-containing protein, partial [Candidatus Riflebacteria bacterium]|nr:HEAT repeat domain-containing protein [Candidatus Riflebacteria bacterium]